MVTETHDSGIRRNHGQGKPSNSPLIARDVEVGAQRPPHIARLLAVLDGLGSGPAVEGGEHVVDEQRTAPYRAKLAVYELVEFRQPHESNLPSASWHTCTGSATSATEAPARRAAAR